MAALTLPASLLARQFQAKASAETPAVGAEAAAAGKEDASFPALFEGLVGGHATAAAASAADASLARGESLPAGQERSSGGRTRGKFTELERLIARTGRVRLPDRDAQETDLVAVQSMDGKPAVAEVMQAAQGMAPLAVPEPQAADAGTQAEQTASLPELRITEPPTGEVHGLPAVQPATVRANTPAAGDHRDTAVATTVGALKIQQTDQAVDRVEAAPPEVRAAAELGVAIPERAQPRTPTDVEPAKPVLSAVAPKLTATAAASPRAITKDAPSPVDSPVDTEDAASETTPTESELPESGNAVPSPPALHAAAEQPVLEWAPKAIQLATPRPAANDVARRSTGTAAAARAGRQSTAINPGRRQEGSAAGTLPEMPVSAAPAVVPENLPPGVNPVVGATSAVSTSGSLAPKVLAAGAEPAMPLGAAANEKEPDSPSVSDELPVDGRLDGGLKAPISTGTRTANSPADPVTGVSPRNADNLAAGGAKVRTLSIASTDRGEVAFTVELRPAEEQPATTERVMPQAAMSVKAAASETVAAVAGTPAVEDRRPDWTAPAPREDSAKVAEASARGGDTDRPATGERERKQAPERSPRPAPAIDSHPENAAVPPGVKVSNWAQSGAARQESLTEPAALPDAAPARAEEPAAARMDAKAEVQAPSAHEIKLEVSGGERRVEVRLSERGGEVRVAVRTPDSHLAGTLRESLPELTTRFAESGLRSEIWRPAGTPAGETRHAAEATSGNLAQDAESQSRGNGGEPQGDAQQRQQRSFFEPKNDKEKGKDFAWLMSSLR